MRSHLNLLTCTDSTEGDLRESHLRVRAIAYAPDYFVVRSLDIGVLAQKSEGTMTTVEYQSNYVFLGHFGELLGEERLETDELYNRVMLPVVCDNTVADGVVGVRLLSGVGR